MQRKRVRQVWYGTAQRIRIDGGTTDMRWFCVGGSFAVIGACHMVEQGCNDDAYHRFLGCPNAAANCRLRLPQGRSKKSAKRGASGCNTLASSQDFGSGPQTACAEQAAVS